MAKVYVFNGDGRFPGGVFSSVKLAEQWIARHRLTGILTAYPLDIGSYDFALEQEWFIPTNDEHRSSSFVSGFTSAYAEHYHYEEGRAAS